MLKRKWLWMSAVTTIAPLAVVVACDDDDDNKNLSQVPAPDYSDLKVEFESDIDAVLLADTYKTVVLNDQNLEDVNELWKTDTTSIYAGIAADPMITFDKHYSEREHVLNADIVLDYSNTNLSPQIYEKAAIMALAGNYVVQAYDTLRAMRTNETIFIDIAFKTWSGGTIKLMAGANKKNPPYVEISPINETIGSNIFTDDDLKNAAWNISSHI